MFEGRLLGDDHFSQAALSKARETFQTRYTLEQIIDVVCTVYKVTPALLAESGRKREVAEARAVVAFMTLESDPDGIGDLF